MPKNLLTEKELIDIVEKSNKAQYITYIKGGLIEAVKGVKGLNKQASDDIIKLIKEYE